MEDYREKSFWLSELDLQPGDAVDGRIDCDVAIVGGGFTGVSAAYFLKQLDPSMDVVVLEKDLVGYGASGRNAGFSMTLFGFSMQMTRLRFGKDQAVEAHRYMNEAVSLVQQLVEEHDIDCDYEHNGFMRIATSERYVRRIKKELEFAAKMGIDDMEWMSAEEVAEQVQSPVFRGAAYEPHAALLNPAKLIRGLKDVAEAEGADIYEGSPVTEIDVDNGVVLTTPGGEVHADRAVLATNAYTHLLPLARSKQAPAFTHIILTEPLSDEHFDKIGWENRQGLEDARNMIHYFRLTDDNRLLIGGSDVKIPFGDEMGLDHDEEVFGQLKEGLDFLFPALSDLEIEHRWGGPVSVTLDMAPAIGEVKGGRLLYSVGCTGHGVSLTHLNGKTLAELITGKTTERTETFFVNRWVPPWPPEPLRFVATQTVRNALRFQDRITDSK